MYIRAYREDVSPKDFLDLSKSIKNNVKRIFDEDYSRIEEKLEEAIQGGECGVTVLRSRKSQKIIDVIVDPDVSYGNIRVHFTSEE